MAIKIPSKNIYDIDNPKIRDNMIDNVNVEQTVIKPNNEYDVSVYNEKITNFELIDKETVNYNIKSAGFSQTGGGVTSVVGEMNYVGIDNQKTSLKNLKIPILQTNKYIDKIKNGLNRDEENEIKVSLYGNLERGTATATWNATYVSQNNFDVTKGDIITTATKTVETNYSIPKKVEYLYNGTLYTIQNEISTIDVGNIATASFTTETIDNTDYFVIDLEIFCSLRIVKMGGAYNNYYGSFSLDGEYEHFTPLEIEITLYGNTIGIDLTDGSVTYGSGNKPFLLSGNELIQHKETINYANVKGFSHNGAGLTINGNENNMLVVNGTCVVPSGTVGRYHINLGVVSLPKGKYILKGMPKAIGMSALILHNTEVSTIAESFYEPIKFYLEEQQDLTFYFAVSDGSIFNNFIIAPEIININNSEYLANNILKQYSKGKETATLLCDISDYYDESGEKVIDIKTENMSFRLHDEVIPYVFGADGKDKPMSKNQDGSAKVFEVVGSNIIYDGAVWQELTLQEV